MNAAVLSPHLDDAVLSCWHVLEASSDVAVVNVFTGSPPRGTPVPWWDHQTGARDSIARMGERRAEDRRALGEAGRTSVDLGLLDAQYGGPQRSAGRLVERLATLLDPGTVIHAPAALSRHPDHEFVRDAALQLARDGRPLVLYVDLPHGITHGWPAWVTGVAEGPAVDVGADWAGVLAAAGLIVERLVPRVRPLDADARARKLRALAAYRTQRAALDAMAFVPLDDPQALAFEVGWAVPVSALGDPQERRRELLVADAGREPPGDRR